MFFFWPLAIAWMAGWFLLMITHGPLAARWDMNMMASKHSMNFYLWVVEKASNTDERIKNFRDKYKNVKEYNTRQRRTQNVPCDCHYDYERYYKQINPWVHAYKCSSCGTSYEGHKRRY